MWIELGLWRFSIVNMIACIGRPHIFVVQISTAPGYNFSLPCVFKPLRGDNTKPGQPASNEFDAAIRAPGKADPTAQRGLIQGGQNVPTSDEAVA